MFTGIVEEIGTIEWLTDSRIRISASAILDGVQMGESIAVNGCCLTVVDFTETTWDADVSPETVKRTSLSQATTGSPVNLERAVRAADRLGGHLVQGHVDGVGEILQAVPNLRVRVPVELVKHIVQKGSITVDGVSLTVVDPVGDEFTVAIIPHTAEVTTLGVRKPGDLVNIEVDVIAKYVERLLAPTLNQLSTQMTEGTNS